AAPVESAPDSDWRVDGPSGPSPVRETPFVVTPDEKTRIATSRAPTSPVPAPFSGRPPALSSDAPASAPSPHPGPDATPRELPELLPNAGVARPSTGWAAESDGWSGPSVQTQEADPPSDLRSATRSGLLPALV